MGKLKTPDWVLEGYDSIAEYEKARGIKKKKRAEKTFKIRECPECGSNNVAVVLTGEEGRGARDWECRNCKWAGKNIREKEITENEFMEYLDKNSGEVPEI